MVKRSGIMLTNARHDPRAVANKILEIATGMERRLTPMQLLKLVYFAHGWALGVRDRGLFEAPVKAWQYGPVVPDVYWAFNSYGRYPIDDLAKDEFGLPFVSKFDDLELTIMREVVRTYGHLHAFKLSDMTHEPRTPWSDAFRAGQRNDIPTQAIHRYFAELAGRA